MRQGRNGAFDIFSNGRKCRGLKRKTIFEKQTVKPFKNGGVTVGRIVNHHNATQYQEHTS